MGDDFYKRPDPKPPANLDSMTPRQAWNAALDAADEIAGWEAFWNDGRGCDFRELQVDEIGESR